MEILWIVLWFMWSINHQLLQLPQQNLARFLARKRNGSIFSVSCFSDSAPGFYPKSRSRSSCHGSSISSSNHHVLIAKSYILYCFCTIEICKITHWSCCALYWESCHLGDIVYVAVVGMIFQMMNIPTINGTKVSDTHDVELVFKKVLEAILVVLIPQEPTNRLPNAVSILMFMSMELSVKSIWANTLVVIVRDKLASQSILSLNTATLKMSSLSEICMQWRKP